MKPASGDGEKGDMQGSGPSWIGRKSSIDVGALVEVLRKSGPFETVGQQAAQQILGGGLSRRIPTTGAR